MKIVVTFAVEAEFLPWLRSCPFRRIAVAPKPVYEARVAGAQLRAVLTGIGARSLDEIRRLLLEPEPDLCISTGLAGGLKPEHRSGEMLVARAVRSPEGTRSVASDGNLVELAIGCGAKAVDRFQTSPRVLSTAQEKSQWGAVADAVEMESFLILSEMSAHGVPAVAVRAIADPVEEDLPIDFNAVLTSDGRVGLALVVALLLKGPHRVPALLRLGSQSRRAASGLASFLNSYLPALLSEKRSSRVLSEVAAG